MGDGEAVSISLSDLPPDMRKQAEAKLAPQPKLPAHKQEMNKTEAAFLVLLQRQRFQDIKFASVKLRLAERCWLTPDFSVRGDNGRIILFEVKGGFVREDSMIKFKVARQQYPEYDWEMWQCVKGKWKRIR